MIDGTMATTAPIKTGNETCKAPTCALIDIQLENGSSISPPLTAQKAKKPKNGWASL